MKKKNKKKRISIVCALLLSMIIGILGYSTPSYALIHPESNLSMAGPGATTKAEIRKKIDELLIEFPGTREKHAYSTVDDQKCTKGVPNHQGCDHCNTASLKKRTGLPLTSDAKSCGAFAYMVYEYIFHELWGSTVDIFDSRVIYSDKTEADAEKKSYADKINKAKDDVSRMKAIKEAVQRYAQIGDLLAFDSGAHWSIYIEPAGDEIIVYESNAKADDSLWGRYEACAVSYGKYEGNRKSVVIQRNKKYQKALINGTAGDINDIRVESISLNKSEVNMEVGDVEILQATVSPSDATNKTVSWSSGDESIVTVYPDKDDSSKGVITAGLKEGTAIITASIGDISAVCKVTVKKETEDTTGSYIEEEVRINDYMYRLHASGLAQISFAYNGVRETTVPATIDYRGQTYKINGIDKKVFWKSGILRFTADAREKEEDTFTIMEGAFLKARKLEEVDLSECNVKAIGSKAFKGCSSLKTLKLRGDTLVIADNAFKGVNAKNLKVILYTEDVEQFGYLVSLLKKKGLDGARFVNRVEKNPEEKKDPRIENENETSLKSFIELSGYMDKSMDDVKKSFSEGNLRITDRMDFNGNIIHMFTYPGGKDDFWMYAQTTSGYNVTSISIKSSKYSLFGWTVNDDSTRIEKDLMEKGWTKVDRSSWDNGYLIDLENDNKRFYMCKSSVSDGYLLNYTYKDNYFNNNSNSESGAGSNADIGYGRYVGKKLIDVSKEYPSGYNDEKHGEYCAKDGLYFQYSYDGSGSDEDYNNFTITGVQIDRKGFEILGVSLSEKYNNVKAVMSKNGYSLSSSQDYHGNGVAQIDYIYISSDKKMRFDVGVDDDGNLIWFGIQRL